MGNGLEMGYMEFADDPPCKAQQVDRRLLEGRVEELRLVFDLANLGQELKDVARCCSDSPPWRPGARAAMADRVRVAQAALCALADRLEGGL
jgi:hypothetical protein